MPGETSNQQAIKTALIGAGYFGLFQLKAWKRLQDVELVAVVESSLERRAELANQLPVERAFSNIEDMLAVTDPDLVDIATPPSTHLELIRKFAGVVPTIICQKPFCETLDNAKSAVKIAEAKQTKLIVHENFRFMPWYRAIKAQIEKGVLGTIRQATFRFRPGDGNGPDAYMARQPYFQSMPRFLVHETAIHWIDTFRYLFGEPATIYADLWQNNPVIAGEDSGLLILGYEEGKRIVFDGSRNLDHAAKNHRLTLGEMIIEGNDATLALNGDGQIHMRDFAGNEWTEIEFDFQDMDFGGDCVYRFQEHVVSHLVHNAPIETLASDYLKNLEIEEAAYRSDQEARQIRL